MGIENKSSSKSYECFTNSIPGKFGKKQNFIENITIPNDMSLSL